MRPTLDDALIETLTGGIRAAASADEAIAKIAELCPPEFAVSRVGLRWYERDEDTVLILAVWSKQPTAMGAGRRHLAHGVMFESFATVIHGKRSDIRIVGDHVGIPPVLEELLKEEGNAAAIQIPIMEHEDVLAVLAILSADAGTFQKEDLPFYDRLGAAISPVLLPLARAAAGALRSASGP